MSAEYDVMYKKWIKSNLPNDFDESKAPPLRNEAILEKPVFSTEVLWLSFESDNDIETLTEGFYCNVSLQIGVVVHDCGGTVIDNNGMAIAYFCSCRTGSPVLECSDRLNDQQKQWVKFIIDSEYLDNWDGDGLVIPVTLDLSRFPHKCATCGSPAYKGLHVGGSECSAKCGGRV